MSTPCSRATLTMASCTLPCPEEVTSHRDLRPSLLQAIAHSSELPAAISAQPLLTGAFTFVLHYVQEHLLVQSLELPQTVPGLA